MSSKSSKKATTTVIKPPEPIITRTKSAQLRQQLKNKEKKNEKPKLTKPEIKSPKLNKTVVCSKESLLKNPAKSSVDFIEQVEYYPNKLKRDICTKKIMLKPKHNFKVIATTNKRKLATPQKGLKSPPSKQCSQIKSPKRSRTTKPSGSPELSMQDMVRIMEETRSLSDEDFMEILTCPSPVWWEDPPDGSFDEDSIHTRSPEPPPKKITKETKKGKITTKLSSNKSNNRIIITEHSTEQKTVTENKKDERFVKKKLKLENILGNIKNKTIKPKDEVKHDEIPTDNNRKLSESEGDISDLSFNEEELLKNLENMEIPIEQSVIEPKDSLDIKKEIDEIKIKKEAIENYENEIASKNDNVDRENLSLIKKKPEIKDEFSIKSSVFDKDSISDSSSQFKSDVSLKEMSSNKDEKCDEIVIVNSCTNSILGNNKYSNSLLDVDNSSNSVTVKKNAKENTSNIKNTNNSNAVNNNDTFPNKKTNDVCEFITVYKIIPEKAKIENPENDPKSAENTKLDTVRGKLNDFFKQCKSNKRLKKTENPIPAIPLTDVKKEPTDDEKENGDNKIDLEDEKNRLKSCNYCLEKTENVTTTFSCENSEMAPILLCNLCNFLADTKEVYRNHVSSCKDVARIPWTHTYMLNQT